MQIIKEVSVFSYIHIRTNPETCLYGGKCDTKLHHFQIPQHLFSKTRQNLLEKHKPCDNLPSVNLVLTYQAVTVCLPSKKPLLTYQVCTLVSLPVQTVCQRQIRVNLQSTNPVLILKSGNLVLTY